MSKFDESKMVFNPFSVGLVVPVNEVVAENYFKLIKEIIVPKVNEFEAVPFAKLYCNREHRLIINKLKPASKELLLWIVYTLGKAKDYLWIDKKRYMKEVETSLNTYKKSIDELIRCGFITPSIYKDVYWINPEFFFKGSRIKKYPKKVRIIG